MAIKAIQDAFEAIWNLVHPGDLISSLLSSTSATVSYNLLLLIDVLDQKKNYNSPRIFK